MENIPEGNYPLTVGTLNPRLVDERFGDGARYYLYEPKDIDMRVPDQIKKTILFIGLPDMPEPEYRGTGFIVTVPGTQSNHFAFMVTARHVAERLQGKEFYIRANKRDRTFVALKGRPTDPWWFHPTDRKHVDAAVTFFAPQQLGQLDIEAVPFDMFLNHGKIEVTNIGVGDEVFIPGLFTKVTETSRNIPIVRTGTIAMIPGERIPFGDEFIDAYLIESRSIGGLSGSPVFVRQTVAMGTSSSPIMTPQRIPDGLLQGLGGRIYLLGSMIGHWDVPEGFSPTQAEAVNMGIAPVVPASKILEVIFQPELVELMDKINAEMKAKNQKGAKLDFAETEKKQPFTKDDFEAALKKVSRKASLK
jgi:hypothetical protein